MISNTSAKLIQRVASGGKEKKKSADLSVDIGMPNIDAVLSSAANAQANNSVSAGMNGEKSLEDSFERYYNKDLDLDEGKCIS